jgi:glycosyltransferase involved in cell wall biosynthesis
MTFLPVADKPGYIPHLEKMLQTFNVIIAFDSFRISSFQASRAAANYNIPFLVVCSEWEPYSFQGYRNVQAIHFDVVQKATHILATSQLTVNYLMTIGISPEKIGLFPLSIDRNVFRFSPKKREKFRSYVNLVPSDLVVLFRGKLESSYQPELVIHAFSKLLQDEKDLADCCKLLVVGEGHDASAVKRLAYETGLGSSIAFLHQDVSPFVVDLYSACDVIIAPKLGGDAALAPLPFTILQAMACGLVPLVYQGTVAEAWIGSEAGLSLKRDSFVQVAQGLGALFQSREALGKAKHLVAMRMQCFEEENKMDRLGEILELLLSASVKDETALLDQNIFGGVNGNRSPEFVIDEGRSKLTNMNLANIERSEILREIGDSLVVLRRFDEASSALSEAIELDDTNWLAFKALGFLAWHTYSNHDAIVWFQKALKLKSIDSGVFLGLGLVHQRVGMIEEALVWLEKAIQADEYTPTTILAFMQVCHECSRADFAIATVNRVLNVVGDHQALLMGLGQLHIKSGDLELGNRILLKAMSV